MEIWKQRIDCGLRLIWCWHLGEVLNGFATKRGDSAAVFQFLKRAIKLYGQLKVVVTDRRRSYQTAIKMINNAVNLVCGCWLNNRAENSHQPFRWQKGVMVKFMDVKTLWKFSSGQAYSP
jgi:putative transposase